MHIIKTTTRGRITLPVDIRLKFGIKDGTKVRFQIDEDKK
jgi:AbrB family looped-hinge helix DNA binding protein